MAYQAGHAQLEAWPCEGRTVHAGVGWFHPFGRSNYYAIAGECEEKKAFPIEQYFTEDWMDVYDTDLFCIYRTERGDIYAYDGIFIVRDEGDIALGSPKDNPLRRDVLVNVIVGGTGEFEGARGVMIGTAEGAGGVVSVAEDQTLPDALLKCLSGYMKVPVKE